MNPELITEINRLGGDPTDPMWEWFLFRGPHGTRFTWSQTRNNPPGYVGLEHLKEVTATFAENDPDFSVRVHDIAMAALQSNYPELVRRGIQVIAVVGDTSDLEKIKEFSTHENASVEADAKACYFELKQRQRRSHK